MSLSPIPLSPRNRNRKTKKQQPGYLYVLKNPIYDYYHSNLYKIGLTRNLNNRIKDYTTSYPEPSEYYYTSPKFSDCQLAEKTVFYHLQQYRYQHNREFFQCPLNKIIATIENVHNQLENKNKNKNQHPKTTFAQEVLLVILAFYMLYLLCLYFFPNASYHFRKSFS